MKTPATPRRTASLIFAAALAAASGGIGAAESLESAAVRAFLRPLPFEQAILRSAPAFPGLPAVRALPAATAAPAAKAGPRPGDSFQATVVRVDDGDTVVVRGPGGDLSVRLTAVDTPEMPHPEHGRPGQPFGPEATEFTRRMCLGKAVRVVVDDVDSYGRLVGWVYLPGDVLLQGELLRNGWAWWYFFYNHDQALNELENAAQAAGIGLWRGKAMGGESFPEAPWVFRRRVERGIARLLPGAEFTLAVHHLSDADTLARGTRNSVYDYVRMAGVDAPEVGRQGRPGQPYGREAAEAADRFVRAAGMSVTVRVEDVDAYGRIVAWISLPGRKETLNELLLSEGWAWWYERYYPDRRDLAGRQQAARGARRGLWADPNPEPPWEFRRRQRPRWLAESVDPRSPFPGRTVRSVPEMAYSW